MPMSQPSINLLISMVKMINATFGNTMWVADDRVEEYKAAGHTVAPAAKSSAGEPTEKKPKKATKKKKK